MRCDSAATSNLQGRRTARTAAVIVLKTVGGGGPDNPSGSATTTTSLARRSVESVGDSTTTVDEPEQYRVKSALYSCTSGGSTGSVEHGKMMESTTLDMDLMSTSRGSDEDWTVLGLGTRASADPWSAITHRQTPAKVITLTTTAAVVGEQGQQDERQTDLDWSGTAGTPQPGSSGNWWAGEGDSGTSTRMSEVFPPLGAFQTTLQDVTGVPGDTERLIDDANDRSIL